MNAENGKRETNNFKQFKIDIVNMAKPPYKPSWNIESYLLIDRVDLYLKETAATRENMDFYQDIEHFGGIIFYFDNLEKNIFVWVSLYWKHRDWAKKIANEKNADKFPKVVIKILEKEMEKDFSGYKVFRVNRSEINNDLENLFLYEIVEFTLYKQHYYRADVQMLMPQEDQEVAKVQECSKCGWVLSADAKECPRCKTPVPEQ